MTSPASPSAALVCAALALTSFAATAHPDADEAPEYQQPPPEFFLAQAETAPRAATTPAPQNEVSITIENGFRVIRSNGWPDHAPGAFPRRGNPNTATPQSYTFRVPLEPRAAATPERHGGWWFAVALNGVPFEPGTGETWNNDPRSGWRYEAHTGFLDLGLDENNAHVQPTGAYHYHALPTGLVARLGGDGKKMLLVGWAADGFPLYTAYGYSEAKNAASPLRKMKSSWRLKTGARPAQAGGPGGNYDGRFTQDWEYAAGSGDLDESNGRFGVTPEFPQGTYHYYITDEFPFVPRLWHGTPDESFSKHDGPPPGGGLARGGPDRPPGPPGPPDRRPNDALGAGRPGEPSGPGGQNGPPRDGRPVPPIMRALDTNGDGVLDADEIAHASESLRKLDRNGDGKLTEDELRPPRPPGGGPPRDDQGPRGPRGGPPRDGPP